MAQCDLLKIKLVVSVSVLSCITCVKSMTTVLKKLSLNTFLHVFVYIFIYLFIYHTLL